MGIPRPLSLIDNPHVLRVVLLRSQFDARIGMPFGANRLYRIRNEIPQYKLHLQPVYQDIAQFGRIVHSEGDSQIPFIPSPTCRADSSSFATGTLSSRVVPSRKKFLKATHYLRGSLCFGEHLVDNPGKLTDSPRID